jgi:hypothetical protein
MLRVLWLAGVIACSGASAPPPVAPPPVAPRPVAPPPVAPIDAGPPADARPLDQDLARLVERSLAMYGDVAAALTASTDCAAVSERLRQLATAYRDVVAANAKVLHDGRARELRAALDPHGDAFDASARAIVQSPTMAKCSQDRSFAKAFDELLEPPP